MNPAAETTPRAVEDPASQVIWTAYGAPAYDVLRDQVASIQRHDPLAVVSVVVPSNLCGIVLRRHLAATTWPDGRTGVAGLSVLTLDRVAELLAAPTLTARGLRPATGPVTAAAWRSELEVSPGIFASVAEHPSTVTALVEAHRLLRELTPTELDAISASASLTADVVRLHRGVQSRLQDHWYDVATLHDTAREILAVTTPPFDPGSVIVFLPQDLTVSSAALLNAYLDRTAGVVIAGLTGDSRSDAGIRRTVARLVAGQVDEPSPFASPTAQRVMHASDADDEVRLVVRDVVSRLSSTPAHRVAVLYGSANPYSRLLHEHFLASGISVNGPGPRASVERVFPRSFLDLLDLLDVGVPDRASLFAFLADAPVVSDNGSLVPSSRWERISRLAGVASGSSWSRRLTRFAEGLRAEIDVQLREEDPYPGRVERLQRDAEAADSLLAFVTSLSDHGATGRALTSWVSLSSWSLDTLHQVLGTEDDHRSWPEEERRAAQRLEQILGSLAGLEPVEASASLRQLREVVELELTDDVPRVGRFGTGVLVAPLSSSVGLDVDAVYVVGLAEGLCPTGTTEDALLPDRARDAAGDSLPGARERLDRQHRFLLAALCGATEVTATFPRGDLRGGGSRLPSRWLLPTLRALAEDPTLAAAEWDRRAGEWLVGSPSYAASISRTPIPANEQEWRLRALSSGELAASPMSLSDPTLDRAIELQRSRRSPALTRFDGNLTSHAGELPNPADGTRLISPTALESWVACPHAYFVKRLLRVDPVEQPEEQLAMSPLERGSLLHEAVDRFFDWLPDHGGAPDGAATWTDDQRAGLRTIATEVSAEFQERGVTGHPVMWARDRLIVLDDLNRFLDEDERVRADEGRQQIRSELGFGRNGTPPVQVFLPDGREIRLIGSADRVDRTADGSLVVVDYKSGSATKFKGLSEDDPDRGGLKLQLPAYAYAAIQLLGPADVAARAEYWFIGARDRGLRIGYPLTAAISERYAAVLSVIVDGISGGVFPANPPEEQSWASWVECPYCDPDGLGAAAVRGRWRAKRTDPIVAPYLQLVEPASDDGGTP